MVLRLRGYPDPYNIPTGTRSPRGMFVYHTLAIGEREPKNNAYLLASPATHEAILIDTSDDAERVLAEVARRRVRVRMILLTHGHKDHWGALGALRDRWGVPVGMHLDDVDMVPLTPNFALADDQQIEVGTIRLHVLHTPGHTPGSVCLLADGILLSGDTLFAGAPGATDESGGDYPALMRSLRERIFTLPGATIVLPGHGKPTTIAAERPSLEKWEQQGV